METIRMRGHAMRAALVLAMLLPVTLSLKADDAAKKDEELKWARGVADDFFVSLKKQDQANVEALLTPDYAKLLQERSTFKSKPGDVLWEKIQSMNTTTITSSQMSPESNEAVFKGQFESPESTQAFTLRVVKDKPTSLWRVGLMMVDDYKQKPKPGGG
jgi:hypothetical protein